MASNPEPKDYGLGLAYRLAAEQLSNTKNLEELCRKTGARIDTIEGRLSILLKYLGKTYRITHPEIYIIPVGTEDDIPIKQRLLVLHYLNQATGAPAAGKLITFQELPEGIAYFGSFRNRAVKPLLDAFGKQPERLPPAAEKLFGAAKAEPGDVSVTIDAFPRVPITLVLWRGDEELAAEGSILFDAGVPDYLSTEDITVLCETITRQLINFIKA